ncbi:MAG: fumarate hydratase [Candidatus Cloacimonetes bacterium]|jgi:fumarate hydratase subunit alpha|nr:fumarate hydratase [Candidatus Cloacimonadota bacterium]MBT6994040.1 fumarate hydratase [Candidatus Cloacimonadota bacterium]MBT7469627.1 fumarate hydratase [Candidatus Cloacimonadota bacterium]
MREINVNEIIPIVKNLCIDANYFIGKDLVAKIKEFYVKETSPTAKDVLDILLKNYELAAENRMPICQDTGIAVIFVEIGQDVHIVGGDFTTAINEGVKQGYEAGYLRKSMVNDPIIERKNTTDNTPAIIYTEIVAGEDLKITVAPKGGGSENMSEVKMMKAADGIEGVIDFVVDRIARSGGNPCPPIIVGVGLGGNFEQSALLSKKSLLRNLDEENPDPKWAEIEKIILGKINNLGIGPQGLGGNTTALAVHILTKPCHIASMPVAVNVQCHAARHKSIII